jgi:hypothetical protein
MSRSPLTFQATTDLAGRSVVAEKTYAVPAGAGTYTVKAAPGRLISILVTTAGTSGDNALIYDNAEGAASGTILASVLGASAVYATESPNMPAANGITVVNVAGGPAFTIGYS